MLFLCALELYPSLETGFEAPFTGAIRLLWKICPTGSVFEIHGRLVRSNLSTASNNSCV